MTVTGKPQGQRERREIGGVRELDESSGQAQLRLVSMQGNPFNSANHLGEITGRAQISSTELPRVSFYKSRKMTPWEAPPFSRFWQRFNSFRCWRSSAG